LLFERFGDDFTDDGGGGADVVEEPTRVEMVDVAGQIGRKAQGRTWYAATRRGAQPEQVPTTGSPTSRR
jgi:hypothetical protein